MHLKGMLVSHHSAWAEEYKPTSLVLQAHMSHTMRSSVNTECTCVHAGHAAVGSLYRGWPVYIQRRGRGGGVSPSTGATQLLSRDMVVNVVVMIAAPPTW